MAPLRDFGRQLWAICSTRLKMPQLTPGKRCGIGVRQVQGDVAGALAVEQPPRVHDKQGLLLGEDPQQQRTDAVSARELTVSDEQGDVLRRPRDDPRSTYASHSQPEPVETSARSWPPGATPTLRLRSRGALAEWLRSGLQSRLRRFDSGRRLRL